MEQKYNNILTVILVIAIAAIIVLTGFWFYDMYTKYKIEKEAEQAIKEFENIIAINQNNIKNEIIENVITPPENIIDEPIVNEEPDEEPQNQGTVNQTNKYKNFTILGYIEIPKTGINYPVLQESSPKALNVAVSQLYGPGLNQVGNTVIIGHNNRNGLFFSNNKKLVVGDIVYITDLNGNKITYTIYNKYETTDTDTEYMTRDTGGTKEISLSTCTDDGSKRIVIWARAL